MAIRGIDLGLVRSLLLFKGVATRAFNFDPVAGIPGKDRKSLEERQCRRRTELLKALQAGPPSSSSSVARSWPGGTCWDGGSKRPIDASPDSGWRRAPADTEPGPTARAASLVSGTLTAGSRRAGIRTIPPAERSAIWMD